MQRILILRCLNLDIDKPYLCKWYTLWYYFIKNQLLIINQGINACFPHKCKRFFFVFRE